jgi:O-methyltransferase involved in polyketide biosynthesis
MDPLAASYFRASIVARARYIEDLVVEQAGHGVGQYVILGAGLETFAPRRPEIASSIHQFTGAAQRRGAGKVPAPWRNRA